MKITQQQENLILLARAGNSMLYRFYFSKAQKFISKPMLGKPYLISWTRGMAFLKACVLVHFSLQFMLVHRLMS